MITKPPQLPWWQRSWLIALALFAAVLLNNSQLIFHSRIYEQDDYAADSLQILKAKQFHETLGHYCRFQFHHPGPAFFYLFGWGELLFSDGLKLVPTPFNAQLIVLYGLNAFFFSAALMIVARRLRKGRSWFLGLALLLAAASRPAPVTRADGWWAQTLRAVDLWSGPDVGAQSFGHLNDACFDILI